MGWLIKIGLVYLLLINLIAYGAMGLDKRKAKRHQWRIPESVLFTWVLLGGGFESWACIGFITKPSIVPFELDFH